MKSQEDIEVVCKGLLRYLEDNPLSHYCHDVTNAINALEWALGKQNQFAVKADEILAASRRKRRRRTPKRIVLGDHFAM